MRSLNLSRLAKASESSFFKTEQALQARSIRKNLTSDEILSLKSTLRSSPTVDTLSTISAQTVYSRHTVDAVPIPRSVPLIHNPRVPIPPTPSPLRALGPARLSVLSNLPRAAPSPVSKVHAEGASLAVASFSVATAIVAGIGLVGGVALYMHPPIVHAMRDSTRRFARSIDNSLGAALRVRVEAVRNRGPIVSPEWQKRTGRGLTQAVGGHGLLGKSSTREDKARKPDGKDSA